MTDQNRQLTREEQIATKRDFARKTLENLVFQNILGSNQVRSNQALYGTLGVQGAEAVYPEAMGSEEAGKSRTKLYQKAKKRGDHLGVYGEPAITNYEVSADIIEQIEENKKILPLGELAKIVKAVAPGFKFEVPAQLKDYVPGELYAKIQMAHLAAQREVRKPESDGLSETERDAFIVYQKLLSPAYDRGVALKASQQGYFADLNEAAEQFAEKYKAPEANR